MNARDFMVGSPGGDTASRTAAGQETAVHFPVTFPARLQVFEIRKKKALPEDPAGPWV
jgi:hypothetical protein